MFRLLGTVARGSTAVGIRNAPKAGLGGIGGGGPATTALFCISALWNVGQTFSFATARTPHAMSSSNNAVDVSYRRVYLCSRRCATKVKVHLPRFLHLFDNFVSISTRYGMYFVFIYIMLYSVPIVRAQRALS